MYTCTLYIPATNIHFQFQFWMEFVPLWEVKGQQMVLVEEWLKVEAYQKPLPSNTTKITSDDGVCMCACVCVCVLP